MEIISKKKCHCKVNFKMLQIKAEKKNSCEDVSSKLGHLKYVTSSKLFLYVKWWTYYISQDIIVRGKQDDICKAFKHLTVCRPKFWSEYSRG